MRSFVFITKNTHLGGAELSVLALMKSLKAAGARVFLITSQPGALHNKFEQVADAITLAPLPYPRKPLSWLGIPLLVLRVLQFRSKLSPSLECIANDFYETYACSLIARLLGARRTVGFWQSSYSFDSGKDLAKWQRYGANSLGTRLASYPVAQHINEVCGVADWVTPFNPFVDDTLFDPACYNREKIRNTLGWSHQHVGIIVARVGSSKGQIRIAKLFMQAAVEVFRCPNLLLCIVGPADPTDKIELSAMEEASGGRVTYLGPRGDIPELLAASDVALFPGTIPESFGLSLMEALLMELPVLALKNPGAVEILLSNQPEAVCASLEDMMQKWQALALAPPEAFPLSNRVPIVDHYGCAAYQAQIINFLNQTYRHLEKTVA